MNDGVSTGASTGCELLTTAEMAEADRLAAIAMAGSGSPVVPSFELMLKAGRAVAEAVVRRPNEFRVLLICGPGNNGGDGFVAARHLEDRERHSVRVVLVGDRAQLRGDAARAAQLWDKPVLAFRPQLLQWADVVVDAMFGAGLSRPLSGEAAQIVDALNTCRKPIVAVDVPSGLDGTTGIPAGPVVQATETVTFFRRKPGHLLLPGRRLCGPITLAEIGLPRSVLETIQPTIFANAPGLWLQRFPQLLVEAHKYTRGHALVVSGPPDSTGAARLGARAALRVGAGLVTVASPLLAFPVNAAHLTAIMLKPFEAPAGLAKILEDKRLNAVLIGPGCGVGAATRQLVRTALASDAAAVLDADALTSFALDAPAPDTRPSFGYLSPSAAPAESGPQALFKAIAARPNKHVVLTPHEGEFKRLFGALPGSKLDRARAAAKASGAVVVLKGADTVIASPDGRAAINDNAPPWLATAGSGDVLAGFVTGLLAQGMPAFEAACAAVWLHGECANVFGPGLIAEDLPEVLPKVLAKLLAAGSEDRGQTPGRGASAELPR